MNSRLRQEIERRYPFRLTGTAERIVNGDECAVWRVSAKDDRALIVRVSPAWRTGAELRWVHDLTRHCAAALPEVVAPFPATDNSTLFLFHNEPVSLFPFVEGETLDTDSADLRAAAARLLAQIHAIAQSWTGQNAARPPSRSTLPQPLPPAHYPAELVDPELDAWRESLLADSALTIGPMHGDFYERNILCREGRICGIIDWDESRVGPIILETGWCVWEFCQDYEIDDLIESWAHSFLQAYLDAAGPLRESELAHVIPAIRWRLRDEAVHALAARDRGEDWDADYTEREIRAFQQLRGRTL